MFTDTVVDSLEMSAKNHEIFLHGKSVGHRLVELLAVGTCKDYFIVMTLFLKGCDATVDRLYLHHHTGTTAERIIVNTTVFVESIVAKIVDVNLCNTFFLRTAHYRAVEKALNHLRQYCYNVYSHM